MAEKALFLNSQGIIQQLPDGSIINIGGASWPTFTVNGVGIVLENGTITTGGTLNLQTIYNGSIDINGDASIKLLPGRDLVVYDDTNNSIFFKIDSETGKITITGDLEVAGSSVVVDSTIQDADHWRISPVSAITTALKIEPEFNSPIVDLVSIKNVVGGPIIFKIDKDGNTYLSDLFVLNDTTISGDIIISGLVDGVDISTLDTTVSSLSSTVLTLSSDISNHITSSPTFKHAATEISVIAPLYAPSVTNVQELVDALEQLLGGGGPVTYPCNGFEHIQNTQSIIWSIAHLGNTKRVQVTIYDNTDSAILPDEIILTDNNNITVTFTEPQDGRAILILF